MYRAAGPGAGNGQPGAGGPGGDPDQTQAEKDVIDAEFEETK